jgi:flagellar biosynthesis/type III secretory pathway protein FliH
MSHMSPEVVLRQLRLDTGAAVLTRGRPNAAAQPAEDPVTLAVRAGYEEGRRSGREEGLRLGYREGERQGVLAAQRAAQEAALALQREAEQAQEQQVQALRSAVSALQQAVRNFAAAAEDDLVTLCLETVGRVMGDAARHRDSVAAQVRMLLAQWRDAPPLAIHLHPDDLALLRDNGSEPGIPHVADPQVEAGGCILRGTQGALDARLDRSLEAIKRILLQARSARHAATP